MHQIAEQHGGYIAQIPRLGAEIQLVIPCDKGLSRETPIKDLRIVRLNLKLQTITSDLNSKNPQARVYNPECGWIEIYDDDSIDQELTKVA